MKKLALALLIALGSAGSAAAAPITFPQNAFVVMIGDSTSAVSTGRYAVLFATELALRYPGVQFSGIYSLGWSGAPCSGIGANLSKLVLPRTPDLVILICGINDVPKDNWSQTADTNLRASFTSGHNAVKATWNLTEAQIIQSNVIPVDPDQFVVNGTIHKVGADAQNAAIAQYNASVASLAQANGWTLLDIYTPVLAAYNARHNDGLTHTWWMTLGPGTTDGLHPSWAGAKVWTEVLLDFIGSTAPVATAVLDASVGVMSCTSCAIDSPSVSPTSVSFNMSTDTLPWQSEASLNDPGVPTHAPDVAIPYYPGAAARNALTVRISNLSAGHYNVTLGTKLLGSFTDAQLATGVDVGPSAVFTPQVATIAELKARNLTTSYNDRYAFVGPSFDGTIVPLHSAQEIANWHTLGGRDSSLAGYDTYLVAPERAAINAAAAPSSIGAVAYSITRTGP